MTSKLDFYRNERDPLLAEEPLPNVTSKQEFGNDINSGTEASSSGNDATDFGLGYRHYGTTSLLFVSLLLVYSLRVNLSIAIVPMSEEFKWDSETDGVVLSSFFWGYIVTQVPGGWLATRFGGKQVMTLAVVGSSVFTVLLPVVADNYVLLLACRVATGLCEAVSYPAIHALLTRWAPPAERSRMGSIIWSGAFMGTVLSLAISPVVIGAWGWRVLFYLNGVLGGVWWLLWQVFGESGPETCRWVKQDERAYLISFERKLGVTYESKVPLRRIFSSSAFWAIAVNHFASNWFFYISLTWLPTYMDKQLHFDLKSAGFVSFLPYMAMFCVTVAGGQLADFLITKKTWRVRNVRKLMQGTGTLVPAACLVVLAVFSDKIHPPAAVTLMTVSLGAAGTALSGYGVNHLDISPKYAGVLMGITNTIGTLPGIVGVLLTGWLLEETQSWPLIFSIAAGIYICAATVMFIWARGEVCIE